MARAAMRLIAAVAAAGRRCGAGCGAAGRAGERRAVARGREHAGPGHRRALPGPCRRNGCACRPDPDRGRSGVVRADVAGCRCVSRRRSPRPDGVAYDGPRHGELAGVRRAVAPCPRRLVRGRPPVAVGRRVPAHEGPRRAAGGAGAGRRGRRILGRRHDPGFVPRARRYADQHHHDGGSRGGVRVPPGCRHRPAPAPAQPAVRPARS